MPKVVSNTTPIISLLKIDRLDILRHLYSMVYIPKAVYKEIESGKNKEFYKDLNKIDWIKIVDIQNPEAVKYFSDLDSGEAEAIVLATELNADLVLIDEKLGRYHAGNSELKISGTLGVLIKAKAKGVINDVKPLLDQLINSNVWIGKNLKKSILKAAGEL